MLDKDFTATRSVGDANTVRIRDSLVNSASIQDDPAHSHVQI
jgi:hypothetical protein